MTKQDYLKYQEAVQRGLKGLNHVSTGACPGCAECGLETKWHIIFLERNEWGGEKIGTIPGEFCLNLEHGSEDDALREIELAKADPDLAGLDLSGLTVQEVEPTDRERESADEPHFSWSACECCGSRLGGDRHPAHGVDSNGDILHFSVCTDCLYYLNYGQLDDMTMMEMAD